MPLSKAWKRASKDQNRSSGQGNFMNRKAKPDDVGASARHHRATVPEARKTASKGPMLMNRDLTMNTDDLGDFYGPVSDNHHSTFSSDGNRREHLLNRIRPPRSSEPPKAKQTPPQTALTRWPTASSQQSEYVHEFDEFSSRLISSEAPDNSFAIKSQENLSSPAHGSVELGAEPSQKRVNPPSSAAELPSRAERGKKVQDIAQSTAEMSDGPSWRHRQWFAPLDGVQKVSAAHNQAVIGAKTAITMQTGNSTSSHTHSEDPRTIGLSSPRTSAKRLKFRNLLSISPLPQTWNVTNSFLRRAIYTDTEMQVEQQIEEFLKSYGASRKSGFKWLPSLFIWVREELENVESICREGEVKNKGLSREVYDMRSRLNQLEAQCRQSESNSQTLRDMLSRKEREYDWAKASFDREKAGMLNTARHKEEQLRQAANEQIEQAEREKTRLMQEHEQNNEKWRAHLKQEAETAKREKAHMRQEAEKDMERLRNDMEGKLELMKRKKDEVLEDARVQIQGLTLEHEKLVMSLNNTINEKNIRIASYSTGNYTPMSDQTFSRNLQNVAQQISNLVACVPRPPEHSLDDRLDPAQYLQRHAHQGNHVWSKFVRGICWRVLTEGFFTYQLGLGVFGSRGEGHDALFNLSELFMQADPGDSTTLLPNHKDTNVWRASLFEAVLKDIKASAGSWTGKKYPAMFRANVTGVTEKLVCTLQNICGDRLDPRAPQQITKITNGLGLLALEMASQRAQVLLETCQHGDWVKSDMFADENDTWGSDNKVDLMLQPCLRRIGDGRGDLKVERVIVKGNIVALRAAV
ncbi:hypothetical protein F4677DRAFT_229538 [Hypoxylon crocopeplum]|nr:hypothetical protein F4677DRAFT_229538 [Hypoxylon crocopeplum]